MVKEVPAEVLLVADPRCWIWAEAVVHKMAHARNAIKNARVQVFMLLGFMVNNNKEA